MFDMDFYIIKPEKDEIQKHAVKTVVFRYEQRKYKSYE